MNLVIGSSSQLAHYFPEDYVKISSREISPDIFTKKWDAVYIVFAEQRVHSSEPIDYITPNVNYTLDIIDNLIYSSSKIVCYSSCELWNNLSGSINLQTEPNYKTSNDYIKSKLMLISKIKKLAQIDSKYRKVIFIHPFYFNSVYRNKYFLFGKIFDAILHQKQIEVGNLDFQRDMVHTSFVVKKSIEATKDMVVGSGQLFNVRSFIKDLFQLNNLDYNDYVKEDMSIPSSGQPKLIMAEVPWVYTYQDLLHDTQMDILNFKSKARL